MSNEDNIIEVEIVESDEVVVEMTTVEVVPVGGFVGNPDTWMRQADYDADNDGVVDAAEQITDGTNTVTAAQARSHIDNAAQHRTINDTATGATNLWSAQKITSELAEKSDTGHTHPCNYACGYDETFTAAELDVNGDLTVTHNLNTRRVRPVIMDPNGETIHLTWQVIDANTVKLLLSGLDVTGTWEVWM